MNIHTCFRIDGNIDRIPMTHGTVMCGVIYYRNPICIPIYVIRIRCLQEHICMFICVCSYVVILVCIYVPMDRIPITYAHVYVHMSSSMERKLRRPLVKATACVAMPTT